MTKKISKDLRSAQVSLDLPAHTECTEVASGKVENGFKVYPVRIKLPGKEKITLHFTKESDRQIMITKIMQAQGFASQLEQYEIVKHLGKTTMKAIHKQTQKSVVIKVVARKTANNESTDEHMQNDDSSAENGTEVELLAELELLRLLEPLRKEYLMPL